MKKGIACFLLMGVLLGTLGGCKTGDSGLTVLDANGAPVENAAYVQIVQQQVEMLTGGQLTEGTVYTPYQPQLAKALKNACDLKLNQVAAGCAVTDLEGRLLAVYSTDESVNYALQADSPYSAFKPLSVYAQALENGKINWSSHYEDSPYKQLADDSGQMRDWPANHTNTYTRQETSVYEAIRKSVNTVAVKCLADVGVSESIAFLQKKLNIRLSAEEYAIRVYGEEDVLGNIALGYLTEGVTPVDMAGYYQMFANGGKYTPPVAVMKLCDGAGETVYEWESKPQQVISATTAGIMNKLLQGVVTGGGTGEMAAVKGVQVAGKTGTGDANSGNWFVGITPGYSIAFWHGSNESNIAPELFGYAVESIYQGLPGVNTNFVTYANLQELVCCAESGMAVSGKCTRIEKGYFAAGDIPETCDSHG